MRVVDDGGWFRVTELGDGITLVEEPYAGELVSANLWHVRGRERDLVLDAGLGVVALRRELPWLFEHDPVLVLSHAHLDHMGGAHEFADVRVHEAELAEATAPGPSSLRTRRLLQLLGLELEAAEASIDDVLLDALPSEAYDLDAYQLHGSAATGVRDGDVMDLGDRAFTVVHLPGHTPGSLNLLDAEASVLLSGDVVYEGGLIDTCTGSDVRAYRQSMQRLLELDVERVLPGHGPELDRAQLRAIAARLPHHHPRRVILVSCGFPGPGNPQLTKITPGSRAVVGSARWSSRRRWSRCGCSRSTRGRREPRPWWSTTAR